MSEKRSASRRLGLRFTAGDFTFGYKTEFEDGSGTLLNISGGGCAVKGLEVPLAAGEKVLVILELGEEQVEIGARVLRIEKGVTALEFVLISEESRKKLIGFFADRLRSG